MVVGSRGDSPAMARMPSVPKSLRWFASFIWVDFISFLILLRAGRLVGRGAFYVTGEGAVREPRGELVAGAELCCGADQAACSVNHQGVAAVEDSKRRKRVEPGVNAAHTDDGALQCAFDGTVHSCA